VDDLNFPFYDIEDPSFNILDEYERQAEEEAGLGKLNTEQSDVCLLPDFFEPALENQRYPWAIEEQAGEAKPIQNSANQPNPEQSEPAEVKENPFIPIGYYTSKFGRIRSSRTGIRSRSGDIYCFREQKHMKEEECRENNCEYWEDDYSHCGYSEEERNGEGE